MCQKIEFKKTHYHQNQRDKIHKMKGNQKNPRLLKKYLTIQNETDFAHSVALRKQEMVHALFKLIQKRRICKKKDLILQDRYNLKSASVCLKKLDNLDVSEFKKDFKYSAVVQKEKVQGKIHTLKENPIFLKKHKIKPFTIVLKKLDDLDIQRKTNDCRHSTVSKKHVLVHNKDGMQGRVQKIKGNQDYSTLLKKYQPKPTISILKKLDNSNVPRCDNNLKHFAVSKKQVQVQNKELMKQRTQKMKENQPIAAGPKNEYSHQHNILPLCFYVSD